MTKLTKKINVLLDEKTYCAFTTIANIRNESPTKILRPAIERYIRENQQSAFSTFADSLSEFSNSEVTKEQSSNVATIIESTTTESEEHFRIYAQVAEEHPDLVIVADDGIRYLVQSKELKQALRTAGLSIIPVSKVGIQPVINGEKSTKKLFKLR